MARKPQIWFRQQTGWYMTTIRGEKIKLSKDKKEAEKSFHTLLAHDIEPEVTSHLRPSFRLVADKFLDHSLEANEKTTWEIHKRYLQSFCDHVKNRKAPDVRGEHITSWLKTTAWGESTRSLAIQAVKAALNYAVLEGRLAVNPLAAMKQGKIRRRERILTTEEREKIRVRATGTFKDFLFALEQTGARPYSEIGRLTADMINWAEGTAVLPKHKNARHGKVRTLYFTPELLVVIKRLAEAYPTGLLFRNRYGNQWDKAALHKWGKIFDADLGIKRFTAYALRHSYATDAITRGVPLPILAELMGTSVKMLLHNYSHVNQKKEALLEAAKRAVG